MASKFGKDRDPMLSPKEGDLSVQPIKAEKIMPIDGPAANDSPPAGGNTTLSDVDTSSVSVGLDLASPFQSPKVSLGDGMSDTTLEEGETPGVLLESNVVIAPSGDVVQEKAPVEVIQEMSKALPDSMGPKKVEGEDTMTDAASHVEANKLPANPNALGSAPKDHQEANPLILSAADEEGDCATTDGERVADQASTNTDPTRSIPPHLRLDFQPPAARPSNVHSSRYTSATPEGLHFADSTRGYRQQYGSAHHNHRSDGDRGELARLSAQLMKTRNELDAERMKSTNMRKTVEGEKQQEMNAALASMTTDLLRKQADALSHKTKVEAKERDLAYREARIEQLEVFLSEGQKQLYHQNDGELGDRTIADVDREHGRRQVELKMQKLTADMEGKLATRLQHLQLREAAQQMREQQYKAIIRSSLEADIKGRTMPEIEARISEVADIEYNRGFGAGKEAGRKQAQEEAQEMGFLEGYGACRRAEVSLSKVRQGLIPCDSPELDFIYDPAHPNNPFNVGERMGKLGRKKPVQNGQPMAADSSREKQLLSLKKEDSVIQKKADEPVRKLPLPPPRLTFASELRGAQTMHNGHVVLANGSTSSSPAPTPKANCVNGGGMAERMGKGVYEGRRIIKYEETEDNNLIDLY